MTKAQERALEAYPYKEGYIEYDRELVEETQGYYIEGYIQALYDVRKEVNDRLEMAHKAHQEMNSSTGKAFWGGIIGDCVNIINFINNLINKDDTRI